MKKILVKPDEAYAVSKYIRISPSKIRRVLQQIQGKSYRDALLILEFLPYSSCEPIIKVLRSAAANAIHNNNLNEAGLIVKSAFVDKGPTLKRFRPRAKGRFYRILKSTSHITIIVEG
jgi:large subunit ribosomal protein L22